MIRMLIALLLVIGLFARLGAATAATDSTVSAPRTIEIGNLIYAGTKSSKCFSDAVLKALRKDAQLDTPDKYTVTKLAEREGMARIAAALMTGEGSFTLTAPERVVLKDWLERGGFLIASSSCSSKEWSVSFRAEAEKIFGKGALVSVAADHPLFSTVYQLKSMPLRSDGSARFEGVMIDGRLACLFSPEGLNDTAQVQGCCCCGGNEVKNAQQVVANALEIGRAHV